MRKILFSALLIVSIASSALFARKAVFNGEHYTINLNYNDSAYPGDAVFVKMKIGQTSAGFKKAKIIKNDIFSAEAQISFYAEGKESRKAKFYQISKSGKNSRTLLAGIPLSSWWTKDTDCVIKITYSIFDETKEFDLPFTLVNKEFVSETLDLDDSNTKIKTDTSIKRMEQIAKLNSILQTTNTQNVWTTQPFTPPVSSTRRTSFFADRRVYKYNTGKSSTSLHHGIDYGVPEGTEVHACADGKVVLAEDRVTTGWSIVIEHLPGLYTLYYHMSEMKVKEGDVVKQGQTIGLSGCTGLATGPHLHWEARLNAESVSPDFFTGNFAFDDEK